MKRLFAALHLAPDPDFEAAFTRLRRDLADCRINWAQPSQLHLTLKFFGETPESSLPAIISTLTDVSALNAPFFIETWSIGIFGSSYQPRVIWVGFRDSEPLQTLGTQVLDAFPRDRQNFVPHLTLGRIKQIESKTLFQQAILHHRDSFRQSFLIAHIILFESILNPEGPTYLPLFQVPLQR